MSILLTDLQANGILQITLNRPEKLNALNAEVLSSLSDAFSKAASDSQVKGVLITGQGKAFCAGADISRLAECNAHSGYEFAVMGQQVFNQLENLGKPSLAAVNGFAFGGGCELAISASIRTASRKAQFGQPEVKLGVIPGYGGTQRLARLIGKGRAMDLCLTGRFIAAEVANDWGLVTHLCDDERLLEYSMSLLEMVLAMGPIAVEAVLNSIHHGYDLSLQDALHLEAVHFAKTCASKDKNEGVNAFLEKRQPSFTGE